MPEGQPGRFDPGGEVDLWMVENGGYVASGCLGVVAVAIFSYGYSSIEESKRARRVATEMHTWPETPGEVFVSEIYTRYSKYGTAFYTPAIKYRYTVGVKQYEGDRILPALFEETTDKAWVQNWIAAYPVGLPVTVSYDPEQPQFALLERRADGNDALARRRLGWGIASILFAFGIVFMIWSKVWPGNA